MPRRYRIHDNGSQPFSVGVKKIKKDEYQIEIYNAVYVPQKHLFTYTATKVFLPGIGREKANSILAQLEGNKYLFIGSTIFEFESLLPIRKYRSPIGNNDVPYPFAVDDNNNYYMMMEEVILLSKPKTIGDIIYSIDIDNDEDEVYTIYYMLAHIARPLRWDPHSWDLFKLSDVLKYYSKDQLTDLMYTNEPMKTFSEDQPCRVEMKDGTIKELSAYDFVELVQNFSIKAGIKPLKYELIHKRNC